MIGKALIAPQSIVVVGGSNDIRKPGGKVLKNLISGGYEGQLYVVNPREKSVQGIPSFSSVSDLPQVELAIMAIAAHACVEAVATLLEQKGSKAVIVLSAGFGEAGEKGKALEKKLLDLVNAAGADLIGPNCIGVINAHYSGVFTTPIPPLAAGACDLVSSSGATAVFLMESGIPLGLKFSNVFSVGNAAQIGIEDILEYMDEHYEPEHSAPIKLLYIEGIRDPQKLLKHARSLVLKGAKIAGIKAGMSQVGSRAVSSHTGAIASSEVAVRALFKKAGIVYCSSREELLSVGSIFYYKKPRGKRVAIITHAGGTAVMLADALSEGGIQIPEITGSDADKLLSYLHPGSSVSNPIDFLATGTAEQLGIIIDFCEHKFTDIDAMVVVFGSPGLFDVENVYNVLSVKIEVCNKPIYPVLPSVLNARKEIESFLKKGNTHFTDEVVLGRALGAVFNTPAPIASGHEPKIKESGSIRKIIAGAADGYLPASVNNALIRAVGIAVLETQTFKTSESLQGQLTSLPFPLAMKVVGPLHKTDVGGVALHVKGPVEALEVFDSLMQIKGATAVEVQPMEQGLELFIGVKREPGFGHIVLGGLGGIMVEVIRDVSAVLAPVGPDEARNMVAALRNQEVLKGYRGMPAVNIEDFAGAIMAVSALVTAAPEIEEMDINPLVATASGLKAIDIRIKKQSL